MVSGPNTHGSMEKLLQDYQTRITLVERRLAVQGGGGGGGGSSVAAGMIQPFAGGTVPAGWLLADGAAVSRSTYSELFNVIGTAYGAGDGSTTFNLPDLRGRFPVGRDPSQPEFDVLGEGGGAKTHRHDFKFALFDKNWSAAGLGASMNTADQAAGSRAGAFRYSTGQYSGATVSAETTATMLMNTAINGGSSTSQSLGRYPSTGDTDVPSGTTGLPPYRVLNFIIATASGSGIQPTFINNQGTTAQRNAVFGTPVTVAEQAALANQVVTWHNTTTGRTETYYATTGTAGLTARGLLAGNASGWYPVAGSQLICTRVKNNGFQAISGGVPTAPTLLAPTVNVGGFTTSDSRDIITPIGGYYNVAAAVYYSGHGAIAYGNCIIEQVGTAELVASRMNSLAASTDAQVTTSSFAIPATTGFRFGLTAVVSGGSNVYGDGVRRLTYLTVSYAGPPLVNG